VLGEDEDLSDADGDSESESEEVGVGSKESDDGLSWLDGPPPKLDNAERCIFSIEDTVDLGSTYLLDLLDPTPTIPLRSHSTSRPKAQAPPPPEQLAPRDEDWGSWCRVWLLISPGTQSTGKSTAN
jgi:hypothetical protein